MGLFFFFALLLVYATNFGSGKKIWLIVFFNHFIFGYAFQKYWWLKITLGGIICSSQFDVLNLWLNVLWHWSGKTQKSKRTHTSEYLCKSMYKKTKEGCVPVRGGNHENRCQEQKWIWQIQVKVPVWLIALFQFSPSRPTIPRLIGLMFSLQYSYLPNSLVSHPLPFLECKCNEPAKLLF